MITKADFLRACPTNKEPDEWVSALNEFLPKYDINTIRREGMFLSQTGHESSDYRITIENLNYSQKGLLVTFSKYYKTTSAAAAHARKPQLIANRVYGGRMGNDTDNDGWFFRGLGIIQMTGRDNHTAFGKTIGMSAEEAREYMQTKRGMVHAACWYWQANRLNVPADALDIEKATSIINGGHNGLVDRRNRLVRYLQDTKPAVLSVVKFGDRGEAVKAVQRALKINDDGIFGTGTKKAVKAFQRKHGLGVDGIVGTETKKSMGIA